MIDIEKAEEEFKRYVSGFNMEESHIEKKVRHTFRVEQICSNISGLLGLSEEEINLAKIIGLLHDIARFEQYTKYRTFDDKISIDHGDLGVEILKENEYIRKYIDTKEYDEIILKAIKNHNKYNIEDDLNKEVEKFCKIIRDADKLDILYEATCEFWTDNIKEIEEQMIAPKVFEQFKESRTINRENVVNQIDRLIVNIAFIFDFNFKVSYNITKENDYINKIIDRFDFKNEETKKQIEIIRNLANNYINSKIRNN